MESSLVESTVQKFEMSDLLLLQQSTTVVVVVAHWESEVQPDKNAYLEHRSEHLVALAVYANITVNDIHTTMHCNSHQAVASANTREERGTSSIG